MHDSDNYSATFQIGFSYLQLKMIINLTLNWEHWAFSSSATLELSY